MVDLNYGDCSFRVFDVVHGIDGPFAGDELQDGDENDVLNLSIQQNCMKVICDRNNIINIIA